jgi:hypothetical protein
MPVWEAAARGALLVRASWTFRTAPQVLSSRAGPLVTSTTIVAAGKRGLYFLALCHDSYLDKRNDRSNMTTDAQPGGRIGTKWSEMEYGAEHHTLRLDTVTTAGRRSGSARDPSTLIRWDPLHLAIEPRWCARSPAWQNATTVSAVHRTWVDTHIARGRPLGAAGKMVPWPKNAKTSTTPRSCRRGHSPA